MKEHDIVVLKRKLGGIDKGTKGIIVYVYKLPWLEVEFDNPGFDTPRYVLTPLDAVKKTRKRKKL